MNGQCGVSALVAHSIPAIQNCQFTLSFGEVYSFIAVAAHGGAAKASPRLRRRSHRRLHRLLSRKKGRRRHTHREIRRGMRRLRKSRRIPRPRLVRRRPYGIPSSRELQSPPFALRSTRRSPILRLQTPNHSQPNHNRIRQK